ncbi:hypothetical protein ARMA_1503 [Ardenticatena maritima]|uniref:Membrane protein n=1 Tax=Ardenticatena maritima TaxID=872965 RepID=A0A0M9UCP7_9CHLR|nr:DUF2892 domain-containing protein [Ardenticatena maritima]KPL87792.1 membrane protein [Ardenticatena maritima]GAP63080.1 hypothetical protein ARMA_1503 [Ardenticatena maritima]
MPKNMAGWDRAIRIILALLFAYLYFNGTVTGALGLLLLVVGIIFLVTSLVGFCPLYKVFKFSTRKA